jgi:hypothetical protein
VIDVALASDTITIISTIGIPLMVVFAGAMVGIVKAALRIGRYMTLSEESQESTAKSNADIRDKLDAYVNRTDQRLNTHDREIALLQAITSADRKRDA